MRERRREVEYWQLLQRFIRNLRRAAAPQLQIAEVFSVAGKENRRDIQSSRSARSCASPAVPPAAPVGVP